MNSILSSSAIRYVDLSIAKPFIEKWHYSGCVPTGKNIFWGWFAIGIDGDTDLFGQVLYAIADYGIGVNPYQASFLSNETGLDVELDKLLELKRLCRIEPKCDKLPLTAFIARCNKLLHELGYRYVIAFSDPEHNHSGGIYKASNFIHLGKTNEEFHVVDQDGVTRHRRYAYRYAQRNGVTTQQARNELGLTRRKTQAKDRWFIQI